MSSQHYLEIDKANTYITATFYCSGSLNKVLKTSLYYTVCSNAPLFHC